VGDLRDGLRARVAPSRARRTLFALTARRLPTAAERLVSGFGDGSTLPVFDTPFGWLGTVICWENYMPLLRMAMYAKGVHIWCGPTGGRPGDLALNDAQPASPSPPTTRPP
jgi:hypothetical protein